MNLKIPLIKTPLLSMMVLAIVFGIGAAFIDFKVNEQDTPRHYVIAGINSGNLNSEQLRQFIDEQYSNQMINLSFEDKQIVISPNDAGFTVDYDKIFSNIENLSIFERLPIIPRETQAQLEIKLDEHQFNKVLHKFQKSTFVKPINAKFTLQKNSLGVAPEKQGRGIDETSTSDQIIDKLVWNVGNFDIQLQTTSIQPKIEKKDLSELKTIFEEKLSKNYVVNAGGKSTELTKEQVFNVVSLENEGDLQLKIDKPAVENLVNNIATAEAKTPVNQITTTYVSGKPSQVTVGGQNGTKPVNVSTVANELAEKISSSQDYTGNIDYEKVAFQKLSEEIDDTVRSATYTYDIAVWGSVSSDLGSFKALVAETLADSRGWLGAGVSFQEVPSGGGFTIVLSEPGRIASAAQICDSYYSCRVGRYVIINDARWSGGTPAWNNAGGNLRDYRHMVVNHETGHWLGFGHRYCSGAGQPAPVMQQQSISLQGCRFNPWPLASEIASV